MKIRSIVKTKLFRRIINLLDITPLRFIIPSFIIHDPSFYYCYEEPLNSGHSFKQILHNMAKLLFERKGQLLKALEWGPGMNTYILTEYCDYVVSIESNKLWYNRYKRMFKKFDNVKIRYIPFPDDPKGKKRYPGERRDDGTHYVPHPESYVPNCEYVTWPAKEFESGYFDLIFIDGAGYRRDCLRIAKQLINEDGIIILHDYPQNKKTKDMPTGKRYDDVVSEFKFVRFYQKERTTILSNESDWFVKI